MILTPQISHCSSSSLSIVVLCSRHAIFATVLTSRSAIRRAVCRQARLIAYPVETGLFKYGVITFYCGPSGPVNHCSVEIWSTIAETSKYINYADKIYLIIHPILYDCSACCIPFAMWVNKAELLHSRRLRAMLPFPSPFDSVLIVPMINLAQREVDQLHSRKVRSGTDRGIKVANEKRIIVQTQKPISHS